MADEQFLFPDYGEDLLIEEEEGKESLLDELRGICGGSRIFAR